MLLRASIQTFQDTFLNVKNKIYKSHDLETTETQGTLLLEQCEVF